MNEHQQTLAQSSTASFEWPRRPWPRRYIHLGLFIIPMLFVVACGGNSGAGWGPGSTQGNNSTQYVVNHGGLIILAAPTFQFVLPNLVDAFLKSRHLHVPYVFDFSSSKQVTNTANVAAEADVLITDDRDAMVNARFLGFTTSVGTVVATDSLSIILPPSNPGKITTLQSLTTSGLRYLAISNNDGLSSHIQSTLESMNLDPALSIHYAARVYGNIIATYTDGLAAAQAIARIPPQGDFTIAYHTDYLAVQKQKSGLAIIERPIPNQFNPPVQMMAAVVSHANNPTLAQQLIDFLQSPPASLIWTQFGFTPTS